MKHCSNCEGNKAEAHHGDEELLIAHLVGHPAAHHARQHHAAEVLKGCAEREDRGASLAMREADEIECIGRKSKSVAYLFDEDTSGDERQALRLDKAQIDINNVGQGDAKHERPKHLLQPELRDEPAAYDATAKQSDDTQSAIDKAVLNIRQRQASLSDSAFQEERHNLRQQSLWQAEKQDEEQSRDEVWLGEEYSESCLEVFYN